MWAEVEKKVTSGDFTGAIEEAINLQGERYYNIIWKLANLLEEKCLANTMENEISSQQVYDLYREIAEKEENPHFREANDKLGHLLFTQSPSSENEKIDLMNEQLRFAINAKNYTVSSQIFHELSGGKGPAEVKEVGTVDSFIKIADLIKTMSKELEELRSYKAKVEASKSAKKRREKSFSTTMWKTEGAKGSSSLDKPKPDDHQFSKKK
jgi:hypothetical protein